MKATTTPGKRPSSYSEAYKNFQDMYLNLLELGLDPLTIDNQDFLFLTNLFARNIEKSTEKKKGPTTTTKEFFDMLDGKKKGYTPRTTSKVTRYQ